MDPFRIKSFVREEWRKKNCNGNNNNKKKRKMRQNSFKHFYFIHPNQDENLSIFVAYFLCSRIIKFNVDFISKYINIKPCMTTTNFILMQNTLPSSHSINRMKIIFSANANTWAWRTLKKYRTKHYDAIAPRIIK